MDSPIVQGKAYDHATAEFSIASQLRTAVKECKWTEKRDVGKVFGNQPNKLARTRGQYDPTGKLTLYQEEGERLISELGDGWMEAVFDITVTYGMDGHPLQKVVLHDCTITSAEGGSAEGTEANESAFELDVMWVEHNGKKPMKGML